MSSNLRPVLLRTVVRAPLVGPGSVGLIDRLRVYRVVKNWNREIVLDGEKVTVGQAVESELLARAAMLNVITAEQMNNPEGIDWEKFADFLERILPLILEFIKALISIFALI